ncbi:CobW family GTP-binding protein [uncultured Desulfuromusa sp.]|uniref:CobW family GTP-binding protein n=1 Tax=uncultured Desulfuromusa sp. TaxID=219183 RepID=UPI002AA7575F|nr:CobW family GTP-binding protein [uncultured Desulfuromusa sp.]
MIKRLSTILPPAVLADAQQVAMKLLPVILLRSNFIPGVRQRLGWRGVKECPNNGFSIKIAEHAGVFGLSLVGTTQQRGRGHATFSLYYFPDPEEEWLESFSVAACIEALQPDYLQHIREFTTHDTLKALFHIGQLKITYNSENSAVELSLEATEQLILISADGVTITKDNRQEQVIAPGEVDQDLAAFSLALDFFRIIATSFSFCFKNGPENLRRSYQSGHHYIYHQQQKLERQRRSEIKLINFALTWGANSSQVQLGGRYQTDILWHSPAPKPLEYAEENWWQAEVPGARFSVDKNTMGITEHPKLIILTGFLGSGKTSFLNHFIEYQAERNAFVAIVQNEIGAKSLDTHLIGQHYAVTEMDEGCICCTLAGSLKLALSEIISGFQPDFVVVETTGLANPANFLGEISELEDQLDFCSITTVIDATQGFAVLEKYGVAREQVILADVILINKSDDIPAADLKTLTAEIQALNPLAAIHQGNHGDFSAPQLYGVNLTGNVQLTDSLNRVETMHHHTHSKQNISSILVKLQSPLDKDQFLEKAATLSKKVLRIKGIMQFTDNEDRYYYQYVPGSHSLTLTTEELTEDNFLVFIGEEIEKSAEPLLAITAS